MIFFKTNFLFRASMNHQILIMTPKNPILLTIVLFLILIPTAVFALTPIARWDVVPYQRIQQGETFNLGVIAFSKADIDRVEVSVSGQSYSGTNPLKSSSMTYNSRTEVYEYWVQLKASDFHSNGIITLEGKVYGKDGGLRNLESLSLVVNATGSLAQPKAWVSNSGSDSTGTIGDSSKPFKTVGGAVSAAQSTNGGKGDGAIIYLKSGTYGLGSGSISTTSEWLTITRDSSATKENTIINDGGTLRNAKLLKIEGVTIKSPGSGDYVFTLDNPEYLWVNDSHIIGCGRWTVNSNPIHHNSDKHYSTNNYVYDADYGYRKVALVRGVDMVKIGNDAFENTEFVINCTLDDLDNGDTGWHADAYQVFTGTSNPPANNRIIYNYKATDLGYQGVFMRSDAGLAQDNAFVNVMIEMRSPASPNESGNPVFASFSVNHSWDHLIVWNSSFLRGHSAITATLTNSSFIGNTFYMFVDSRSSIGTPTLAYAASGNSGNNEFLYNHYLHVYNETPTCESNERFVYNGWPCPHWNAKRPDSLQSGSATIGDGVIDMSDPSSDTFGNPVANSILIDRIPFVTVPSDIYGNARVGSSDVGPIEVSSDGGSPTTVLAPPIGFSLTN
jgi:hypothetical protein